MKTRQQFIEAHRALLAGAMLEALVLSRDDTDWRGRWALQLPGRVGELLGRLYDDLASVQPPAKQVTPPVSPANGPTPARRS